MSLKNVIRAWKDEEFRRSLSEAERAALPEHPAGTTDLSDAETANASGGMWEKTGPLFACTFIFIC
jgi:mersacidin/lichenicidin family type 2 lantibiotic